MTPGRWIIEIELQGFKIGDFVFKSLAWIKYPALFISFSM